MTEDTTIHEKCGWPNNLHHTTLVGANMNTLCPSAKPPEDLKNMDAHGAKPKVEAVVAAVNAPDPEPTPEPVTETPAGESPLGCGEILPIETYEAFCARTGRDENGIVKDDVSGS